MKRVQEHLNRFIVVYAVGPIAAGLLAGYPAEAWPAAHADTLNAMLTVLVFAVVYPMMVNLKLEALARAARNWRALSLAVAASFLFAARYHAPVPAGEMLATVATVLAGPMILGWLTRLFLEHRLGAGGSRRLQPVFPAVSLISMFVLVALIFFAKAGLIPDRWYLVLLIVVPSAACIVASLALETWINRRLGFSYRDHMAMVFTASSSNNSTAIAIATAPRIRSYFGKQEPPPAAHPGPAGPAAREHKEAA